MLPNHEGQKVPNVTFPLRINDEWVNLTTDELFAGKTVVVFSLPWYLPPPVPLLTFLVTTPSLLFLKKMV